MGILCPEKGLIGLVKLQKEGLMPDTLRVIAVCSYESAWMEEKLASERSSLLSSSIGPYISFRNSITSLLPSLTVSGSEKGMVDS
jgi:hypothetical protein